MTTKATKSPFGRRALAGIKAPRSVGGARGARGASGITGSGVVLSYVQPAKGRVPPLAPDVLVKLLRAGLPVREVDHLQTALSVPMERLAVMLGVSKATLYRRKAGQLLGPAVSDRVVRFARLMGRAIEVLESEEDARRWLASPQFGLGGAAPLDYAQTEVGAREVEALLGRMEHGVYS